MKFSLTLALMASAGLVGAVSESKCARMCIDNMNKKAEDLGCKSGDQRCLCDAENYSFGVRDCTAQACPEDDSSAVVQIALSTCPSDTKAGSQASGSDSDSTGTATDGAAGAGGSASATASGSDSDSTDGAGAGASATGAGASSTGSGASNSASATSSGAESTSAASTSNASSTMSTATSTGTDASATETGSGSGSDAASTSDSADGAENTGNAAPRLALGSGAMGVAGLAALFAL